MALRKCNLCWPLDGKLLFYSTVKLALRPKEKPVTTVVSQNWQPQTAVVYRHLDKIRIERALNLDKIGPKEISLPKWVTSSDLKETVLLM
jgi:hypothetical protein